MGAARARVVVVGAGIVGLTAAVRLAEAGLAVRVVARERTPRTTSDVAAAVWYPFRCGTDARVAAWGARTREVLRGLLSVPEAGVTWVRGTELHAEARSEPPWWAGGIDDVRALRAAEVPPGWVGGITFEAPVVTMPVHLAWLEAGLAAAGVAIETRTVEALAPMLADADAVVHAAGLGAAALAGDPELHPIRGQVVRVAPGGVNGFVQAERDPALPTYVIPRPDCTVLGGTADVGAWDITPDPAVAEEIVARCRALVPAVGERAVLSHAVGLRPGRREVRLDVERLPGGPVVHCYGHGGAGLTLSWGCAEEIVRLVGAELGGPPPHRLRLDAP